ncbi:ADP-ribosylation factor-like protein 13B [Rhynochetos jubatus]
MAGCCGWFSRRSEPVRKVTLVMVGLDNAGKTAVLHGMQGKSLEDVCPTVGFSKIHLKTQHLEVTIFDLGGRKTIRKIWRNYYAESHGVIFVVDSSDIERMEEVKEALREVLSSPRVSGKPMLVLANKQDSEEALPEADILDYLTLERMVNEYKCRCRIEPCSATMGCRKYFDKSIKEALYWLLQTIEEDFDSLNDRIERETAEQRAYEEQQKVERAERVSRMREERAREEGRKAEEGRQAEEGKKAEEGRGAPEEEDPEPGNNANPFQPISVVIAEKEKQMEKEKKQQSLETEKAAAVIGSQTEQQEMDAGHFASSSSQNTNDRLETGHSASAELLQHEEGNAQAASEHRDSGPVPKKRRRKLRLGRGHRLSFWLQKEVKKGLCVRGCSYEHGMGYLLGLLVGIASCKPGAPLPDHIILDRVFTSRPLQLPDQHQGVDAQSGHGLCHRKVLRDLLWLGTREDGQFGFGTAAAGDAPSLGGCSLLQGHKALHLHPFQRGRLLLSVHPSQHIASGARANGCGEGLPQLDSLAMSITRWPRAVTRGARIVTRGARDVTKGLRASHGRGSCWPPKGPVLVSRRSRAGRERGRCAPLPPRPLQVPRAPAACPTALPSAAAGAGGRAVRCCGAERSLLTPRLR